MTTARSASSQHGGWKILLADDHAVLREGLALMVGAQPDMEVVGLARGGREAVALAQQLQPDVAVLDVSMPDVGGAEAAEQIRAKCPRVRVGESGRRDRTLAHAWIPMCMAGAGLVTGPT